MFYKSRTWLKLKLFLLLDMHFKSNWEFQNSLFISKSEPLTGFSEKSEIHQHSTTQTIFSV